MYQGHDMVTGHTLNYTSCLPFKEYGSTWFFPVIVHCPVAHLGDFHLFSVLKCGHFIQKLFIRILRNPIVQTCVVVRAKYAYLWFLFSSKWLPYSPFLILWNMTSGFLWSSPYLFPDSCRSLQGHSMPLNQPESLFWSAYYVKELHFFVQWRLSMS